MTGKKKKIFVYSISALTTAIVINSFSFETEKYNFLETSFLNIMQKVSEESKLAPPDLSIESVSLRKISDPSKDFNYYKYYANILVRNYGGDIENAKVVLSGDNDQKNIFLKNDGQGLSLKQGQNFIADKYEVLFDGNYNGGTITLNIDLKDQKDYYLDNNSYPVDVFELPVKIDSVELKGISEDGEFDIDYSPSNFYLSTDAFKIYTSDSLVTEDNDARYNEISVSDKIYGYDRIKSSKKNINDESWKQLTSSEQKNHKVKFSSTPFEDEMAHFAYVKAVNAENGYYAVSNILRFGPQKTMSRAEFAKLFADYANIPLYNKGEISFQDVNTNDWYAPYAQTLYNLGLLDSENFYFNPKDTINRSAVLRVAMDYFDVDLSGPTSNSRFEDISQDDFIFPYTQALSVSGKGGVFGDNFNPEMPATRNYMKYLINEYQ